MEKILRAFEKSRGKPDRRSERDTDDEPRLSDLDDEDSEELAPLDETDAETGKGFRDFQAREFAPEKDIVPDPLSQDQAKTETEDADWENDWNRPRGRLPEFLKREEDEADEPPLELGESDEVTESQIRDPFDVSRRVEELLGAARAELDAADNPALSDPDFEKDHLEPHFDHMPDRAEPEASRTDSGLRITAISAHDPASPMSEEEDEGFGWTVFFTVLAVVAVAGMLGLFYLAQSHPDAAALLENTGRMIGEFATLVSEWWSIVMGQ